MPNATYYYEHFSPHRVYTTVDSLGYAGYRLADRVWCQGKFGGVRLVIENFMNEKYSNGEKNFYGCKYVTKNEQAMREFAWAKLKAEPYVKEKV